MITIPKTSQETFLSGMYALNIPSPEGTGDWHATTTLHASKAPFLFLCGLHQAINTLDILGGEGVEDMTHVVIELAIPYEGERVFVATHRRAVADLVLALSEMKTAVGAVILDDFMSTDDEKRGVLNLLESNIGKVPTHYKQNVEEWIIANRPEVG